MKRLIYPTHYYSDIIEDIMLGLFSGIDVRTSEEVLADVIQDDSSYEEKADFFKYNDVLFMEYETINNFPFARISENKESFDVVRNQYFKYKNQGLSEEEINKKMIQNNNSKQPKTKLFKSSKKHC